jgi:predicted regulator of Ras-like GTPase activity (Roadblock/LC7/MglB family)
VSDLLNDAVDRLSRVNGVRGAMIVETDAGLPVTAELTEGVDGGAVAALASSLFRRTDRASATAEFGAVNTMQLEADGGHVIVSSAGELLIVVIADKGAQLGLVRLEAHRAAEALR